MASMESITPLARLSRPRVKQIGEMTQGDNFEASLFFLLLRQSRPIQLKTVVRRKFDTHCPFKALLVPLNAS